MKKLKPIVSMLLIFALVFSLTSLISAEGNENDDEFRNEFQLGFEDSDEAPWAKGYIGKMQAKNVIQGYGDGTVRPNAPVTRIEAIVMAVRLMELEDEAIEKSTTDVELHFKDENKIPSWGKGHVIVALENGLFNSTEDKIQPNKPASRLWVVNLLVRALDLEDKALNQMTEIPDFKDADQIPAGSVGYVNVAIEHGLINGYEDNTFKPNRSVTRGEMAAFLDRTNDDLLEQDGAITVLGNITDISFGSSVTDDTYGTDGRITVQFHNGDSFTYAISSDLLVQNQKHLITADQLRENDVVILVVQHNVVLDATLVDHEVINEEHADILEFKVELESKAEQEFELKYKNNDGKIDAKIEQESDGNEIEIKGEQAIKQAEDFMTSLDLAADITEEDLQKNVLNALEVNLADVKELEIKVKFSNGQKIKIEFDQEGKNEDDDEEENEDDQDQRDEDQGYLGVREIKLDVEFSTSEKVKLSYKNEDGKVEAEVVRETDNSKETAKGKEAALLIELLLNQLALTPEMSESEVLELILAELDITAEQVKKLELEVKFVTDQELEIELENDSDDDDDDDE
jgi:hypothetical protein